MTDIPTSEVIADDGKSTPSLSPVDEKYVSEEKAEYSKGSQEVDEHGQPLELHRALSPAQLSMIAIG
jgi:amino acid permease